MTAVLALGSNLGDRLAHLQGAVDLLGARHVSPVYETAPVGGPAQPDYLNAVVLCDIDAATAWQRAEAAERAADRVRTVRWGPRTLDVDLIAAAGQPPAGIVVPHPRAHERAFVLAPWLDVDPEAVLPGLGAVRGILDALGTIGIRRRDDLQLHTPAATATQIEKES
jgi:2-amino-4-hydroxy-6-hydroxymethyldihydropteridine diphosphokinase